jgi:acetyl-CoA acetyltransferase
MASQISDGASAVLLASEQAVKDHKLKPRARIHHISTRGADPVFMLTGPIPATQYALEDRPVDRRYRHRRDQRGVRAGRDGLAQETKADPAKVNPNGGAIALGHPLGATGAKLFTTMLNNSSAPAAATACRRCARAAAPPTSPSSKAVTAPELPPCEQVSGRAAPRRGCSCRPACPRSPR